MKEIIRIQISKFLSNELVEQIAQKIEFQLEVKIAELQSKRKQSSDEKERLNELQQSKLDIQ